jgi:hypothetical protein
LTKLSATINSLKPSDLTAMFNIHKFYVLPTQCIYVFVWISEQTAIISLYNINWLVCITETECVYCAVRTECLCKVCLLRGTDWSFM